MGQLWTTQQVATAFQNLLQNKIKLYLFLWTVWSQGIWKTVLFYSRALLQMPALSEVHQAFTRSKDESVVPVLWNALWVEAGQNPTCYLFRNIVKTSVFQNEFWWWATPLAIIFCLLMNCVLLFYYLQEKECIKIKKIRIPPSYTLSSEVWTL